MTRWGMLMSAAVIIGGCSQEQPKPEPAPAPKAAVTPAANSASAVKPASKLYFEMSRQGVTYVFANVATMQCAARGEQPAGMVTKEKFGPAGETVMFESDGAGMETRLIEEYTKQHPKK